VRRSLPLRLLATAAAVAAAGSVAVVGSTLAGIRAGGSSIRRDPFAGGSVVLVRSGSGAFLSSRNVAIGSTRTRTVRIANRGWRAGDLVVSARVRSNELSRRLRLALTVDGRPLYHGSLAGFRQARAGQIAPGAALTFRFRLVLRSSGSPAGDDALQGEAADASFSWSAASR